MREKKRYVSQIFLISVLLSLAGCSFLWTPAASGSTQEDVDSRDYLELNGADCPPDFKLSFNDDRDIAEWAMGKIYGSSKSAGWWCLINDDLNVSAGSNGFRVWVTTQWDAQQANSIELAREICVAFISPFTDSGIDVFVNGRLLEGEERLDGTAETEFKENTYLARGATHRSDEAGTCQAFAYFQSTMDNLIAKGWTEGDGKLLEPTFRAKLSEREDFYCRNHRCG